jgi:DNA repair exonuclease SbcCD nuclease subunit
VDFTLVAGDTLEDNGVDRVLVQKVADILASFGGPVYVIPGNHDPLVPGSVWDHPAWKASAIAPCAREEGPVEIPGGRCTHARSGRSGRARTPAWIPVEEGAGYQDRPGPRDRRGVHQEEPDYPIAHGAATRARLDYLALGHWHSTATYAGPDGTTRMAFQGTSTLFPKLTCHAALATAAG